MAVVAASRSIYDRTRDKMKAAEHMALAREHRVIAAYHREEADKFSRKKDVYRKAGNQETVVGRKSLAKYREFDRRERVHEVAYRNHVSAAHLHELYATKAKDKFVPAWHTDSNLAVANSTPIERPTKMPEHALRADARVREIAGQPIRPIFKRRKRKRRVV